MADKTLEQAPDHAKPTEAEQLRCYARVAATYDSVLNEVDAILHAINVGSLFDALPAEETDRANHNAGCFLLTGLADRVRSAQEKIAAAPGTDLFIYLDCRASELAKVESMQ